ncbi:anti-sigma factor [Sphaerotilus microaerophilus]|uniref:DNA-directed RNA polymerase sigma-70 factor n=1 Tax=Sphaerotilus microaerophilus TaxID=2914710 RepID=A0ABM7YGP7_9BURK|nr:anti-sigma factor [Sphaerotilus sp. FB-5]BDI03313.1 DNA-directed RNA polymerase sigma-70 factor [Sphaerotilus sp. FB-5]
MKLDTAEDRSAAAGEYVLGTLTPDEQQAFERTLAGDGGLRAEVGYWQDRLLGLTRRSPPAERLPIGGWARLEERLIALASRPAGPGPAWPRWWQRLGLWQGLTSVAVAAVLVLGSTLALREALPPAPEIRYVAVLQDPRGGGNGWVVEMTQVRGRDGELRLVPLRADFQVPPGRVLQFWTKAPGAAGPRSLGLVPAGGVTSLPLQQLPDLQPDQLFEITLEPPGGSTLGRPTGPVLYIGRAVALGT